MNKTIEFLQAIDELYQKPIPEKVKERGKRSLLDYLAVTCAGAKFQHAKIQRYMDFAEPEAGSFRAIGIGMDLALKEAVFLNGLNSHALDFDDGTNSGIIHLGSPIFSLLIPLAQKYKFNIDELINAAVIGYEASYTMAVSIQPGHKARGFHATGTCGTLGSVIAASYLLGFSEHERFNAFASACTAASGMLKVLDEGSELKPYNVAKTSLLALTALQMAKAGFEGPSDPLGGRGFLRMMTGSEDTELKHVLLNGTYAIMKSYTKPYASCRYTHPAVEAAIRLRTDVAPEEIESVLIKTYDLAVAGHDHISIQGSYDAKMSIPYATAAAFIFGKAGLHEFSDEVVHDDKVLKLTKKITVEADDELSAEFPETQAAIVIIKTKDKKLDYRVDFPKGEPENPLTADEFRKRYDELMRYAEIDESKSDAIYHMVGIPETVVSDVVKKL